jgi:tryptophan synthase alpha chain
MSGIDRIADSFAKAKAEKRCALIPYLSAGDPDRETSAALIRAAIDAGVDIIEIGIPYGDPLADGPTIAAASQRALEAGMTVDGALALASDVARCHTERSEQSERSRSVDGTPVLMFTYLNPIVQYGVERFADALVTAGAAGAIIPDLPLEESAAMRDAFTARGLALPLLVAPTTPLERAIAIGNASDGFLYLVSRLGVTGAGRMPDFAWIAERVSQLRSHLNEKPIAVGFGIATPEHVREIARLADGAIIGSALIDSYAGTRGKEAATRAGTYLHSLG